MKNDKIIQEIFATIKLGLLSRYEFVEEEANCLKIKMEKEDKIDTELFIIWNSLDNQLKAIEDCREIIEKVEYKYLSE